MNLIKNELERSGIDLKRKRIKKPKPYKQPYNIEAKYEKELFKVMRNYKNVIQDVLFPILENIIVDYKKINNQNISLDGYTEDMDTSFNQISIESKRIIGKNFEQVAGQIGADISTYSLIEHTKVLNSALGVSPIISEPWLAQKESEFLRTQTQLIKSLNTDTTKDIENIVKNGLRSGLRQEEIKKQIIQKIGDGTIKLSPSKMSMKNRAKLIARDQTTKYYGELNKIRQQSVGLNWYIWQTANDEGVRPNHNAMEGKLCRWDDATVYSEDNGKTWIQRTSNMVKLHPSEDYQCRCYGEPYFGAIL